MTEPTREQIDESSVNERIAEIKKRAEEATEGPWEAKCIHVFMDGRGQYSVGARNRPGGFKGTVSQQDAEFVAFARDDVPWLLEQVQVLQDRIAKVREVRDNIECSNCDHPAKFHGPDGRCTNPMFSPASKDGQCSCTWGGGDIVAQLDAALGGEGETTDG